MQCTFGTNPRSLLAPRQYSGVKALPPTHKPQHKTPNPAHPATQHRPPQPLQPPPQPTPPPPHPPHNSPHPPPDPSPRCDETNETPPPYHRTPSKPHRAHPAVRAKTTRFNRTAKPAEQTTSPKIPPLPRPKSTGTCGDPRPTLPTVTPRGSGKKHPSRRNNHANAEAETPNAATHTPAPTDDTPPPLQPPGDPQNRLTTKPTADPLPDRRLVPQPTKPPKSPPQRITQEDPWSPLARTAL